MSGRLRIVGLEDVARRLAEVLAPEAAADETLIDAEIAELERLLERRRGLGGQRRPR